MKQPNQRGEKDLDSESVFQYGRLLWCGYVVTVSNRDCDSLSLGSIPSSHPKAVLLSCRLKKAQVIFDGSEQGTR